MDEPNDIPEATPAPPPLEALQRDVEVFAQEDAGLESPGPEVNLPDPPAPAEQPAAAMPDVAEDIPAPQIKAPDFEDAVAPILNQFPDLDLSSTPERRKLSAQQKRNGQVEPPAKPLLPDPPADADRPRQQPPQPVAPEFEDVHRAAKEMGAIDQDGVIEFQKAVPDHADAADGEQQQELQAQKAVLDKVVGIETTQLQLFQEVLGRLDRIEAEHRRLLNGNMRRRG